MRYKISMDTRHYMDEPTVNQLSKNIVIFAFILSGHLHVQCLEKKIRNKLKLKKMHLTASYWTGEKK